MGGFRIGTAAWTLPKEHKERFPEEGSHLERYAQVLNAVEINTSFYRPHKDVTYQRWSESVPDEFRFSVKLEKLFTHERKLVDPSPELEDRVRGILGLGDKLGCILVQLPPKLSFDEETATGFFECFRSVYDGPIVFEPRHESWNSRAAAALRADMNLSQVFADPEPFEGANNVPASGKRKSDLYYFRLHGSPQIYKSDYENERLSEYAKKIEETGKKNREVWCIFDNTTFGHATKNALDLTNLLF